ncbi:MAG: SDR family NAD(P)-dependent oxidoreductase [Bdellovibrionales bacterium]|nr:SDR family NAD(P)-dependent oxidoreductase [Bdellovibrionales bacterium]
MSRPCALITGASSGIGAASSRLLAKAGYDLILLARRRERLDKLASELPGQVETFAVDVQSSAAVAAFAERVDLKRVSLLLNNAGLAKGTDRVQNSEVSDWEAMIDTNVKGLLYLTRAVLPHMIQAGRGHVVNIGSVAGRWVYPGGAVYCATKFAVRALSEGLRLDLLGTPIRVTNIEPGMVETEFSQVRFADAEKARKVYEGMTPLTAEDVAEAIVWCTARPSHVNVQELVLFPTDQPAVGVVHRR